MYDMVGIDSQAGTLAALSDLILACASAAAIEPPPSTLARLVMAQTRFTGTSPSYLADSVPNFSSPGDIRTIGLDTMSTRVTSREPKLYTP
jgi:hypothetical protein